MQRVFVLDADWRPLMPCRPARARLLLTQRRAAVFRRQPFTVVLSRAEQRLEPFDLVADQLLAQVRSMPTR
jgi:hypothetical protein